MMQRTYFPRPIFPALARKTRQGHPTSVVANNPIPTYFQPTPNLFLARNILKKAKTSSEISPRPLRPPRSRRVLRGIDAGAAVFLQCALRARIGAAADRLSGGGNTNRSAGSRWDAHRPGGRDRDREPASGALLSQARKVDGGSFCAVAIWRRGEAVPDGRPGALAGEWRDRVSGAD